MKWRSEWQRPATLVRINTSRGPGLLTLTSSITSGLLTSYRTAAFIGVYPYPDRYCRCPTAEFDTKGGSKSSCPGRRNSSHSGRERHASAAVRPRHADGRPAFLMVAG